LSKKARATLGSTSTNFQSAVECQYKLFATVAGLAANVTPSWSSDGQWIYFASNRTGTYQIWKIAAGADETGTKPAQVTHQGGCRPEIAGDGTLFYAKGPPVPRIWSLTREGNETPILADFPAGYWGYWCVAPGGVYFAIPAPEGGARLQFLDLKTHHVRNLMQLERPPLFSDSGMSLAPDGGAILYTQVDSSGSEIILVEHSR